MTVTQTSPARAGRFWMLGVALVAFAGLTALTVAVLMRSGGPFAIDQVWLVWMLDSRLWLPLWPALFLNWIGGGVVAIVVVPGAMILVFLLRRRWWAAVYVASASVVGAGAVQLLKYTVDRIRPDEMLVQSENGSFPSGHAASAAVIAVVVCALFARAWVVVLGTLYTTAMMFSRTFLGVHWLSDTVAGVLLGAMVALALAAVLAPQLLREGKPNPVSVASGRV